MNKKERAALFLANMLAVADLDLQDILLIAEGEASVALDRDCTQQGRTCTACGKITNASVDACQYCGKEEL